MESKLLVYCFMYKTCKNFIEQKDKNINENCYYRVCKNHCDNDNGGFCKNYSRKWDKA